MAMVVGRHVAWRWQGMKECCWLTCIEMVMQYKYGTIYGIDDQGQPRPGHSAHAIAEFRRNRGSHIGAHADHYGLRENHALNSPVAGIGEWRNALSRGPVIAEGNYGWSRFGIGSHVIVIVGLSGSDKLIFKNPNIHGVLPHPRSKDSYFTIADAYRLAHTNAGQGPFWQLDEDLPVTGIPATAPRVTVPNAGAASQQWSQSLQNTVRHI
jgi:hypothetical protein